MVLVMLWTAVVGFGVAAGLVKLSVVSVTDLAELVIVASAISNPDGTGQGPRKIFPLLPSVRV